MPHPQCSLNETSDFAPISDFALNAHVNDHSMSDGVDANCWCNVNILKLCWNFTPDKFTIISERYYYMNI